MSKGIINISYNTINENIYDVLYDNIHLSIGQGGKHRLNAEVKKKNKNITQEAVSIFLTFCESCQPNKNLKPED